MDKKEYLFKVLVVGECETGKTSIITQYVHRKFEGNYKATVSQLKIFNKFKINISIITKALCPPIHMTICTTY